MNRFARYVLVVSLVIACAVATTGCTTKPNALDGTSWKLTGWAITSIRPTDVAITASFADGRISGNSGVNSYSGAYKTGPGPAFAIGELTSTMMAGTPAAMHAEKGYLKLLGDARTFKQEGEGLEFFNDRDESVLKFTYVQ